MNTSKLFARCMILSGLLAAVIVPATLSGADSHGLTAGGFVVGFVICGFWGLIAGAILACLVRLAAAAL